MSYNRYDKQKSLKRRFLLILGVTTFIFITVFGLMVMFWDKLDIGYSKPWRIVIGSVFIIYAILRVGRLFKKDPDDEEE